jgi:TP901 family phage tail tape measure protein
MSIQVADLLVKVRADTADATKGIAGVGASLVGLGSIAVGVAAAAFVKMGIDAQTELSRVQGLAGVTASQMDYYSSALEGMGARIGSTMAESAQGLYYVVSAGFAGADALNVLNYAEMAAHASGANLADVAHGVAGALNAYGVGADQAGKYTDIMTGAVVHGMQTYQQFAQEMGTATATAAAHKVSLIELSAAEASLTQKGLDAASAFTGLTFAMAKVMVGGKEMGDQVRAAGGHLNDAAYSGASFVDRLNMLAHSAGLTQSEFIKLIGGTRSSKAALDLVNDSGAAYRKTLGELQNSAGLTANAFKVHDETIEGAFHRVAAAISNAAYEFVKFITPAVVPFIEAVADKLAHFQDGLRAVGAAVDWVKQRMDVIGPLMAGVAAAILVVASTAIPPLIVGFIAWAAAAGAAAVATIIATWPLLAIAAGIGIVVAALIFAYQHWTGFRMVVDTVRDALGRFFGSLGGWMSQLGSFVQSAIKWFQDMGKDIGAGFSLLGTTIHSWVVNIGGFFDQLGQLPGKLVAAWNLSWKLIGLIVATAINTVIGWFMTAYNHSYLFQGITDNIVAAFKAAQAFITGVWTAITGWLTSTWDRIAAANRIIWSAVTSAISSANNAIHGVIMGVWNSITGFLGGVFNTIRALATSAWNAFVSIISGAIGRAGAAAQAVGNAITAPFRALVGVMIGEGRALIEGLISGIRSMIGAVGSAIGAIAGKIKDGMIGLLGIHNSPSPVFIKEGQSLAQGLLEGVLSQDVPSKIAAHLSSIGGAAISGINVGVSGAVSGAISGTGGGGGSSGGGREIVIHVHPHMKLDGRELLQGQVDAIRIATGLRV